MTPAVLCPACAGYKRDLPARNARPHVPVRPDRNLVAALAVLLGILQTVAGAELVPATVRPVGTTLSQRIDQAIGNRLVADKIRPSPLADDAEFLRRVFYGLGGEDFLCEYPVYGALEDLDVVLYLIVHRLLVPHLIRCRRLPLIASSASSV